jgi:hypothetical protein
MKTHTYMSFQTSQQRLLGWSHGGYPRANFATAVAQVPAAQGFKLALTTYAYPNQQPLLCGTTTATTTTQPWWQQLQASCFSSPPQVL